VRRCDAGRGPKTTTRSRAALGALILLLTLAVPIMHSLAAPATAMAGPVAMMADAPHHAMSAGVASGASMDRCNTHPCAVARTDSTPNTAPPFVPAVPAVVAAAHSGAVSGARASERAPPREGSASRLCIWRT